MLNEFITYGGKSLEDKIIRIFTDIFNTEIISSEWKDSNIISIYKGKGNIEDNKAKIFTRYGLTEDVNLKQGSVLSVSEFATLMDGISSKLLQ